MSQNTGNIFLNENVLYKCALLWRLLLREFIKLENTTLSLSNEQNEASTQGSKDYLSPITFYLLKQDIM